jgi:hypothetical protein
LAEVGSGALAAAAGVGAAGADGATGIAAGADGATGIAAGADGATGIAAGGRLWWAEQARQNSEQAKRPLGRAIGRVGVQAFTGRL